MMMHKPDYRILRVWRINLVILSLIPAFAIALLETGSLPWSLLTGAWALLFLLVYLVYLPLYYNSVSFSMEDGRISLRSGVFYKKRRWMDLDKVQHYAIVRGPVSRLFGLATLVFTAAGGRLTMPGFRLEYAGRLLDALSSPGPREKEEE